MTQRQELETEIVPADFRPLRRRENVLNQVFVGEGDTLGLAGGARCVNQRQNVFGGNLICALPKEIFRVRSL